MFHNEALQALDVLVGAAVEGLPVDTPPGAPAIGNCYVVGGSPSGAWSGHANQLAAYTAGGWRFIAPRDGVSALVRSDGNTAAYRGGSWVIGTLAGASVEIGGQQVVGARGPAIDNPTGGATTDAQARTAIDQILAAMRDHGLIET